MSHVHAIKIAAPVIHRSAFAAPGRYFHLHSYSSAERARVEQYISTRYMQVHNAQITHFMHLLVEMKHEEETLGAIGITPGRISPFFLEQYLGTPIEQQISGISGRPVDRHRIIETGNLAVTRRGSGLLMFLVMTQAAANSGLEWMVFTATNEVKRLIKALGFSTHLLKDAPPECLKQGAGQWGTYYENNPQVIAGNLSEAVSLIAANSALSRAVNHYHSEILSLSQSLMDFRRLEA